MTGSQAREGTARKVGQEKKTLDHQDPVLGQELKKV
jgi:hypothetical protein